MGETRRSRLFALLGSPYDTTLQADTVTAEYAPIQMGADEFLYFRFVADTLREITWSFYVD